MASTVKPFVLLVDNKEQKWVLNPYYVRYGHAVTKSTETSVFIAGIKHKDIVCRAIHLDAFEIVKQLNAALHAQAIDHFVAFEDKDGIWFFNTRYVLMARAQGEDSSSLFLEGKGRQVISLPPEILAAALNGEEIPKPEKKDNAAKKGSTRGSRGGKSKVDPDKKEKKGEEKKPEEKKGDDKKDKKGDKKKGDEKEGEEKKEGNDDKKDKKDKKGDEKEGDDKKEGNDDKKEGDKKEKKAEEKKAEEKKAEKKDKKGDDKEADEKKEGDDDDDDDDEEEDDKKKHEQNKEEEKGAKDKKADDKKAATSPKNGKKADDKKAADSPKTKAKDKK